MSAAFFEPKETVYTILSSVSDSVTVYQERPEVVKSLPSFTFRVSYNNPIMTVDKSIGYQDVEVIVDIWAETSIESGTLLKALVATMLDNDFVLSFSSDVPDPGPEKISHVTTRFNFKV